MTGSTNCPITSPLELQSLALRVVGSEHHGRVLRIYAPKCTIGSAAGCTLRLKAQGVRDVHCLVLRGPGGLVVRNWSPDTRLNGQAVTDAPLQVGDRLAVGPVELEVLDPVSLDRQAENSPPSVVDNGRLSGLEQKARDAARTRDELARRLAERDQFVAQLEERLSTTQQLVTQLQAEGQAHAASPAAPDPATLAEIESLKQQAESLAQQFEVARRSFATERDTWQIERQNLQQQIEDSQNELHALTQAIEQARTEAIQKQAAWDHQHEHLVADLERARYQIATHLEEQRGAREAEVAITHWRERAEELAQQLEELHRTRDDAASEHGKLRAELEAGARELDAETERLFEREEALAAQTQQFEAEYERASTELDARQQQLEALRIDLEARQAALEASAPVAISSDEARQDQAAEIAALQQQLADLQAHYQQQASELEERRAELDERAMALDRQAEELRLEAERLAAEALTLQSQREEASELSPPEDQPSEQDAAETKEYVPQSAADIIARLNASGLWKDDEVAIEEPVAEQAAPEPVWKSLVAEEPKPAPVAAHEEEDSIEAYMQRLLQRVSGESEARPRDTQPKQSLPTVAVVETETPAAATLVAEEPRVEPFDPTKYVPRSTAPEATSKLAAMRALANSSARSAIHISSKRRHAKHLSRKLGMLVFAFGAAISLGWLTLQTHSLLSYYAAIAACVAGLLWGIHAGYLWLKKAAHAAEATAVDSSASDAPLVETEAATEGAAVGESAAEISQAL